MFAINDDMFGLYARIPTGFSRDSHIYKIVARIESNCYCEIPLGTCITKQTNHGEIVPVLLVIHCGIDESKVIRVKEDDCEIVNSRFFELAEADKDGRCVVLPCKVGDTLWNIKAVFSFYPDPKEETVDRFAVSDDGVSAICRSGYKFRIERIGKTVFLTREAAEAALEAQKRFA